MTALFVFAIISFGDFIMDKIYEQTLLYDFYGELLNEHQKNVFEDAVFNDLSLSEVAEVHGITRQAAHDLIRRVTKTLQGYEEKLHMIGRFKRIEEIAAKIKELAGDTAGNRRLSEIRKCADDIHSVMNS